MSTTTLPIIRPLLLTDVPALEKAAKEDNHVLVYPTHVVDRAGAIVGYVSIKLPYVNVWMHTKEIKAYDSLHLIGIIDSLVAQLGGRDYIMLCGNNSNFLPHLERFGLTLLGNTTLTYKQLWATSSAVT